MSSVVFVRETKGLTRRPWALALALGPLALFSLLLLARWPGDGQIDVAGVRALEVFRLFAYAVSGAVLLLAPPFPAASLVDERRRGTLGLLLNSPLSAHAIYAGKLAASLTYALLPLVMSVPCAAACYALGAIDLQNQLGRLYGVIALIALQYAVVALAVSSRAASVVSAMRTTYVLALALAGGAWIPAWWSLRSGGEASTAALWVRGLSPIPALMEIAGHGDWLASGGNGSSGEPLRYAIVVGVTSLALAASTIQRLQPHLLERARASGVVTDDRGAAAQRWRRILFLVDPQRRSKGIPDRVNPVLAKEFRSRRFGRGSWTLRITAFCSVVSLAASLAATTGAIRGSAEAIAGGMVQLQIALILVTIPSSASGLISDEREGGGWALLRMTPLSPQQIIVGKLLSVAWTAMLLLLATLPGYLVIMAIKPVMTRQVLSVLLTLALAAALVIALSAALSSCFRRTTSATVASYALVIALFGGTLAIWAGRDAPFGRSVVEQALAINPAAAALAIMEAPGFEGYRLVPACWWFVGAAIVLALGVLAWRTHQLTQPD